MSTRTIEQLERELHDDEGLHLARPDLAAIRTAGRRRRRLTALRAGVGTLAAAVAVGFVVTSLVDAGSGRVQEPAPAVHPHHLTDLARRALAEVPGAVRVSDWQVVLPGPDAQRFDEGMSDLPPLAGTPVRTGAHHYSGVTDYLSAAFPSWLYEGVQHLEENLPGADADNHPVGTTDMGILVDDGPAYLGCVGSATQCTPVLLTRSGGGWTDEWSDMGTDDFLKAGSRMEVFLEEDYATGAPGHLVLAGLDGTDVARVELVTVDGTRTEGHVESGTVVPGDTMMWGTVTGDLAAVIAYDASGEVVEDHELKPCSGPVDCEVR